MTSDISSFFFLLCHKFLIVQIQETNKLEEEVSRERNVGAEKRFYNQQGSSTIKFGRYWIKIKVLLRTWLVCLGV